MSLHHTHTGEDLTVVFKRAGKYDEAGLEKLNWFLRDWRNHKQTRMDPQLFDIVWEVQRELGTTAPVHIISAYRSPETNSMLRRRSRGVAQFSQHMLGKAMDFFIPGLPLEQVRAAALRRHGGGVGFYPTSGSPFVHLDVGSVRHWPRMTRDQLARVFPDGRTIHVPSDGQPLAGYSQAMADVQRRGGKASAISLAAARSSGAVSEDEGETGSEKKGIVARLFGFKDREAKEDENARRSQVAGRRPGRSDEREAEPKDQVRTKVAAAGAGQGLSLRSRSEEPSQLAPADVVASRFWNEEGQSKRAPRSDTPDRSQAAEPKLVWQAGPQPVRGIGQPVDSGDDIRITSSSGAADLARSRVSKDRVPTEYLLAYAADASPDSGSARSANTPQPMGMARPSIIADQMQAAPKAKPKLALPNSGNSWLRSLMIAPGRTLARRIPLFSSPEYLRLVRFMPPSRTVVTGFADDAQPDLVADGFSGQAIANVPSVRLSVGRTAARLN